MSCTTRNVNLVAVFGLAVLVFTVPTRAATLFSENFSDDSAGPNMQEGGNLGSSTYNVIGAFNVDPGNTRVMLETIDADYSSINFTFEATMTAHGTFDSGYSFAFFGMAKDGGGTAGEPNSSRLLAQLDSDATWTKIDSVSGFGGQNPAGSHPAFGATPVRFRMTWDATTKQALFDIDVNYSGTFASDASFTLDGSDNGFNGTNSKLIVCIGNGGTFDDILVTAVPTPEPGSASLLLLGCCGIAASRRMAKRGSRARS